MSIDRRTPGHFGRAGFTLLELLVVVTIIVVLLSLLAPALDQAMYQAELAVCGANQRGFAAGMTAYAAASRNFYPDRACVKQGYCIVDLKRGPVASTSGDVYLDDRPAIQNFASLKFMVDPLVKSVDLETDRCNFVRTCWFAWYAGGGYKGQTMMRKLGDRFQFPTGTPANPTISRFDIVLADADITAIDIDTDLVPHPDADGVTYNAVLQDNSPGGDATSALDPTSTTVSYWAEAIKNEQRGAVDLNYAHADESVQRLMDLRPVAYPARDDRMAIVPFFFAGETHADWPVRVAQIPLP